MEERQYLERYDRDVDRRRDEPHNFSVWYLLGGVALVGLASLVVIALPDIKRYIKISTM